MADNNFLGELLDMGNMMDDYEQNSDDFFYEDIVEDSVELEEDEESYEQDFEMERYLDGYREDFPDDEELNPLVKVGIAVGLIVVAAVICAILWGATHRDTQETSDNSAVVEDMDSLGDVENIGNEDNIEDTENIENGDGMSQSVEGDTENQDQTTDDEGSADEQGPGDVDNIENVDNIDGENAGGNEAGNVADEDIFSMEEPVSGTTDMVFTEVSETVTAKDITNVRTAPSVRDAYNVIGQLVNGETAVRTGINSDTGWSRIEYNGQTAYAVTQYLTTDLSYRPPVAQNNPNRVNTLDGRTIIFVDCDDYITPKEYVNLRTEPSTSEGNATVSTQISVGTVVHRTGMSPDAGWSRVEVNGQVLYVVSSYMNVAEGNTEE